MSDAIRSSPSTLVPRRLFLTPCITLHSPLELTPLALGALLLPPAYTDRALLYGPPACAIVAVLVVAAVVMAEVAVAVMKARGAS